MQIWRVPWHQQSGINGVYYALLSVTAFDFNASQILHKKYKVFAHRVTVFQNCHVGTSDFVKNT